jgi:hypothetical protein
LGGGKNLGSVQGPYILKIKLMPHYGCFPLFLKIVKMQAIGKSKVHIQDSAFFDLVHSWAQSLMYWI